MLFGFSGASGSGKSTLVHEVSRALEARGYSVGVVNEVARKVFRKYSETYGFSSLTELRNSDKIYDFQTEVLREQVSEEWELSYRYDVVLCDRTIYDNLLYTLLYCKDVEFLQRYVDEFRLYASKNRYELIFLCFPLSVEADDGFRTPDLKYRYLQHELLKMLLPGYVLVPDYELCRRSWLVVEMIDALARYG
ncbi:MAG: AAA family ATPase [Candidatus Thorarchaeota archaeon]